MASLEEQVRAAETAFARSMAERDLATFSSFFAEEAVFLGNPLLRGREAVTAGCKRFFEGPSAPSPWVRSGWLWWRRGRSL